jgi:hypothetical protein
MIGLTISPSNINQKEEIKPMMPNPMQPPSGGPGPGVPVGPGPAADPEGGNPDQIKAQLKMLLKKAKEIADQNGVDFGAVVAEVTDAKIKSDVPLPKPPKPEM